MRGHRGHPTGAVHQSGIVHQCKNYGVGPQDTQDCLASRYGQAGAPGKASRPRDAQVRPASSDRQDHLEEVRSDSSSRLLKSSTGAN